MTDHRLTDLRSVAYRAGALERTLRMMVDYPDRDWPRKTAANLLAEIDASRSLTSSEVAA
jgi:hypothetical protein